MHLCTGFSQGKHKGKGVVKTPLLPTGLQAPGKHQSQRRITVLELGSRESRDCAEAVTAISLSAAGLLSAS